MHLTALVIIFILLALIMLIPLGICASYDANGFVLKAKISVYKLHLYPRKSKSKQKVPKDSTKSGKKSKKKLPFGLKEWTELLRIVLKAHKRLKNGLCIDKLTLHFIAAAPDPYDTVRIYNAVNGLVGAAEPLVKTKKRDIYIDADMTAEKCSISFVFELSIRVGQLLILSIVSGFGFIKLLVSSKIKESRERKSQNGKQQIKRNDAVNDEQYQEPC